MQDDQSDAVTAPTPAEQVQPRWCLVGNIVAERLHGESAELRRGAKIFPGGTKVYYVSAYWGMGAEKITVLGLSRRPRRWIIAALGSGLTENWRPQLVHAPRVLAELHDDIGGHEAEARRIADIMNRVSASFSRRLAPRTPCESRAAAVHAAATLLPGPAPDRNKDGDRPEEQAFVFYVGTRAVAGLVCRPSPVAPGVRASAPFMWRDLWVGLSRSTTAAVSVDPDGQEDEIVAAFLAALQSRFPWHDLTALALAVSTHRPRW